jgi:hypothetical protein
MIYTLTTFLRATLMWDFVSVQPFALGTSSMGRLSPRILWRVWKIKQYLVNYKLHKRFESPDSLKGLEDKT